MNKNKNKGFTLVELLIVIAIIGILSAVIISSLSSARQKSKEKAAIAQMNQARSQAEIYYNQVGSYQNLCGHSTTGNTDLTIKPYIYKALNALGAKGSLTDDYYVVYPVVFGANNQGPTPGQYLARCHETNTGYFFNPRWAAQIPLLRTGSDNTPRYYCIDSTGAGFETTRDLGDSRNNLTEYLSCVKEE